MYQAVGTDTANCCYQTKWYKSERNVWKYGDPRGRFCIIWRNALATNRPYNPENYKVVYRSRPDEKAWFEFCY